MRTDDIRQKAQDLNKTVESLIAYKHEKEWFEFKENWFEPHELGEYISALSNAAALQGEENAYFIWGIQDGTHKVTGTKFDQDGDVKNEPLKHYLARQTKPDIGFRFEEITFHGERLVILVVPAASKMPTAFDDVRYIRIGSSKEKLIKYPEYEARLFYILRNGFPTIANTESEYQELTFNKLFLYFETKGVSLNKRTFKKNLGLLTETGRYNVLAQLLSDDCRVTIRFALFAGKDKTSSMYSVKEFGYTCILYSLDQVLDYGKVLNIPQADERERKTVRKEVPLFSERAYNEAVINAFVHNRWLDGNGPMFTGFQDRLEILSRGALPPKQTVEGFYEGESIPVNEALSRIFIMLHITEHTGRGVPRITGDYGRDTIKIKENSILVTIPYARLGGDVYKDGGRDPSIIGNTALQSTHDKSGNTHDRTHDALANTHDSAHDKAEQLLEFCLEPRHIMEIAEFLNYKERKSVRKILGPLVEQGRIVMTIPDKPKSKNQRYITIKQ